MKSRMIRVDPKTPQPEAIREACEALRRGGLVAFPTDTLYALGANALDPAAIQRVLTLKGRQKSKPVSVLVPSVDVALELAALLPEDVRPLMQAFWPGPLTLVVPAAPQVPAILREAAGSVGLRMPGGVVAAALLSAFGGPITGTSANKAGGADPADAGRVQQTIGGQIDLILDAGRVVLGVPSTVLDVTLTPARILREGAISRTQLEAKIRLA